MSRLGPILICTVGGSPEPVLRSISENSPRFVHFVCSEDDAATGSKGSHVEVTKQRGIATRAGLAPDTYMVHRVPGDDPEAAYVIIDEVMTSALDEPPDDVVADFTGGTKSMSVGLVLAAAGRPSVRLQLVTGPRPDLFKVRTGMERVLPLRLLLPRLRSELEQAAGAWRRFAYDDAAERLDALLREAPAAERGPIERLCALSRGFAAWDRFEHARALDLLSAYTPAAGPWLADWLPALCLLAGDNRARRDPLAIRDLWHNAQRRAAQGRYDDAVARCYRLIEWTAQWLLFRDHGVEDSGKVSASLVPSDLAASCKTSADGGTVELPLTAAWELVARLRPESPAGLFFIAHTARLLEWIKTRNFSILAHGDRPVDAEAWTDAHTFLLHYFLPMLEEECAADRRLPRLPQLPIEPPS